MKGLLYKDLTLIVGSYRMNFVFLLVVYTAMAFALQMDFLAYALVFVVGLYASTTISMDENSRWDLYARTLPVTPGQIVAGKFLLTLGCTAVGAALSFLLLAVMPHTPPLPEAVAGLAAAVTTTLVYGALVIPLSYKFGAAKARSWVMGVLFALFFLPLLALSSLPEATRDALWGALGLRGDSQPDALSLTEGQGLWLFLAAMLAISLLAVGISWAVSVPLYRQKTD